MKKEEIEMEKEFNLSEKMMSEDDIEMLGFHSSKIFIKEEDVKEFIRLLKESYYSGLNKKELFAKIDKLAGSELVK